MKPISVKIINQLKDNYSFILYNSSRHACVIDPAESSPIIKYLDRNNLIIKDIFITHHHKDHTGGIEGILSNFPNVNIHSPNSYIKSTRFLLKDYDEIETNVNSFQVISTPGHTLDHIILLDDHNKMLFCGDTLFRLGCGRIFEGKLEEMFSSLQRINNLDNRLTVYCGHEYTLNNLSFLETIVNNKKIYADIRKIIESDLKLKKKSIPFNLGEEKLYNLFLNQESDIGQKVKAELRLGNFGLFKHLREKKDNF